MNKKQEKGASSCKKKLYEVLKCSLACIYAVFCTVTIKMTWLFYTFQAQATCFDFVALGESLEKLILLKALPFLLFLLRSLKKRLGWDTCCKNKIMCMFTVARSLPCASLGSGLAFFAVTKLGAGSRVTYLRRSPTGLTVCFLPFPKCMGRGKEGIFFLVNRLRHCVIWCSWWVWRHLAEHSSPGHPPGPGHSTSGYAKPLASEWQIQALSPSQVPGLIPCLGPACWALCPADPLLCAILSPGLHPCWCRASLCSWALHGEQHKLKREDKDTRKILPRVHDYTIALLNNQPPAVKALYRKKSNN